MSRKIALLLASTLFACEATGFEPEYLVDTLRVLAIQADAPFAVPNQTVSFTTLWADPNGQGARSHQAGNGRVGGVCAARGGGCA